MKFLKSPAFFFSLFVVLLIVDQWSKIYIKTNFYIGQEYIIFPYWFRIAFVENPGAAFGFEYGGVIGKYVLTFFRIGISIFLFFYLIKITKEKLHWGYVLGITLILSGAIGNVIDGVFYGVVFSESNIYNHTVAQFVPFGQGYSSLFLGKVVDMLYFPMYSGVLPNWLPLWGGEHFTFFNPVFNIADSCITIGLTVLFFTMHKVKI